MKRKDKNRLIFLSALSLLSAVFILILDTYFFVETELTVESHHLLDDSKFWHMFFSTLLLFIVGTVWKSHVSKKIKESKQNRKSGISLTWVLGLVSFTGYFLYSPYFLNYRSFIIDTHTYLGFLFGFIFIIHWLRGQNTK